MAVRLSGSQNLNRTASLPSSAAFTCLLWAVPLGTSGDLIALESSGGAFAINLYLNSGGDLRLWNGAGTSSGFTPTSGTPYAFAMTSNGAGVAGYWRAASANTWSSFSAGAAPGFTAAQLTIGDELGNFKFDGRIWNVKCWDRVLTADELLVESFYAAVKFPTSLHLHWPLFSTSDIADRSGNARDPTVVGTLAAGDTSWQPWKPGASVYIPAAGAGGGDTPVSISDSGTGVDSISVAVTQAPSDSGTGTDAAGIAASTSQSDSGAGADVGSLAVAQGRADSGTGTDVASLGASLAGSDSGVGTDSQAGQVTLALADSGAGVDAASLGVSLAGSDSGTGTDSQGGQVTLALADSGTGNDAVSVDTGGGSTSVNVNDSGVGTDAISVAAAVQQGDAGAGTDAAGVSAQFQQSDTGAGADAAATAPTLSLVDSGAGSDAVGLAVSIQAGDSGTGVDVADPGIGNQAPALADVGSGTDAVSVGVQIGLADAGNGSDAAVVVEQDELTQLQQRIAALEALVQSLQQNQIYVGGWDYSDFRRQPQPTARERRQQQIRENNAMVLAMIGAFLGSPVKKEGPLK